MLLNAALVEEKVKVFDRRKGRSIGFEKCVNLAQEHLGLDEADVGVLRAIDALRDDEQHYLADVSEDILYIDARGAVTLFDELLSNTFGERLAERLPERVLPSQLLLPAISMFLSMSSFIKSTNCLSRESDAERRRAPRCGACSRLKATYPRRLG